MIHHKKKKHHDDGPLPGYGFREVVVFAPSRPPSGCDGHPQCNQIAGDVSSSSMSAPSSPDSGGAAPAGGDDGSAAGGTGTA